MQVETSNYHKLAAVEESYGSERYGKGERTRNLRREYLERWLELAKAEGIFVTYRPGKCVYCGATQLYREELGQNVRVVYY